MEHSALIALTTIPGPESQKAAMSADASLAARGDVRAFERLYREHVARIHSLMRRMISADEAAEVTQDVFVRAWEKLGSFRGEAAFGTWLHRIAINVALTTKPRHGDLSMDFERAIERLPDGARQVFVLHDIEGYTHEEIGSLLEVATGTSKAQLHRARMILRRHLGREWESHE